MSTAVLAGGGVYMEELEAAAAEVTAATQRLHERVVDAVAGGASWAAVGRALGVSAAVARRAHETPVLGPKPAPRPRPARVQLTRGWVVGGVARGAGRGRTVMGLWPTTAPASARPALPAPRPAEPQLAPRVGRPGSVRTTAAHLEEVGRRLVQVLRVVRAAVASLVRLVRLRR